jgi:hypothetical protein
MGITQDIKKLDTDIWSPLSQWLQYLLTQNAVRFDGPIADFMVWDTSHWTITIVEAGGGSASAALQNEKGGVLLVTNDNFDDDSYQAQFLGEMFKMEAQKEAYFECRFQVADITDTDLLFGLCITDTTLIAGMSDGIFWRKDDGDANLDLVTTKDTTPVAETAISTVVANTWKRVGFKFDGHQTITPIVDGVLLPASAITTAASIPDDEELTVSFAIQNGAAAAKTLKLDYILAAQIR